MMLERGTITGKVMKMLIMVLPRYFDIEEGKVETGKTRIAEAGSDGCS